jgi:Zn-dependent metalloprotease
MRGRKETRTRIPANERGKPSGGELRHKVYKTGNGLLNFSMHAFDESDASMLTKLTQERAEFPGFSLMGSANVAQLDPETVAKRYLAQALQSPTVSAFTAPKSEGLNSEFRSLGTVTVPITGTTTVKFRQTFGSIPVYGSLITVELDKAHNLVSLTSSIGELKGVRPVARLAPLDAVKAVKSYPGFKKQLANIVPQLMYYFDKGASKWRLVYFLERVPVTPKRRDQPKHAPQSMDYVVDAHTGKLIAELPWTPGMAATSERAIDGLNQSRQIKIEKAGATSILKDTAANVETFDFGFDDPAVNRDRLPGSAIGRPPEPWPPSAVSAHANTVAVTEFLRNVLGRNNIDNKGGPIISCINCVVAGPDSPDNRQWFNAKWYGDQMAYGQRLDDQGNLISLSAHLDVVGHEIFHGVTRSTAGIEYGFESGALNESYSDIFGVIIANFDNPDPRTWNWKLAAGMSPDGKPFRDMQDPTVFGHPDHMRDFVQLPLKKDYGGVHINSGIHNKAAYNILTTVDSAGNLVFKPEEVAAIFYVALTEHLSRSSQFSDSRRAVISAALSTFGTLPPDQLAVKLNAIKKSFFAVGISE